MQWNFLDFDLFVVPPWRRKTCSTGAGLGGLVHTGGGKEIRMNKKLIVIFSFLYLPIYLCFNHSLTIYLSVPGLLPVT